MNHTIGHSLDPFTAHPVFFFFFKIFILFPLHSFATTILHVFFSSQGLMLHSLSLAFLFVDFCSPVNGIEMDGAWEKVFRYFHWLLPTPCQRCEYGNRDVFYSLWQMFHQIIFQKAALRDASVPLFPPPDPLLSHLCDPGTGKRLHTCAPTCWKLVSLCPCHFVYAPLTALLNCCSGITAVIWDANVRIQT